MEEFSHGCSKRMMVFGDKGAGRANDEAQMCSCSVLKVSGEMRMTFESHRCCGGEQKAIDDVEASEKGHGKSEGEQGAMDEHDLNGKERRLSGGSGLAKQAGQMRSLAPWMGSLSCLSTKCGSKMNWGNTELRTQIYSSHTLESNTSTTAMLSSLPGALTIAQMHRLAVQRRYAQSRGIIEPLTQGWHEIGWYKFEGSASSKNNTCPTAFMQIISTGYLPNTERHVANHSQFL
eukprot:1161280-Pelagomonas_calceolata.AAC.10